MRTAVIIESPVALLHWNVLVLLKVLIQLFYLYFSSVSVYRLLKKTIKGELWYF